MSKKKVTIKNKDNQELEERLKRTLADYQNLERRIGEERKLLSRLSSAFLIEKFLPVLENLENAQKHLNDQGLELVIKQFKEVLASEGVEEIEAEGKDFDPIYHEAIEAEPGEVDNKITKVLTKGYKIEDKVIKPSRVVVTKKGEQVNV
jgi:molecular chaperone GrpE